ncbi:hypothetical protein F1D05_33235 [Kribbella qitaiheensis]|uniref:Phosphotransferase n=1 Tax=Kribbella qitaiheensis TaxID=1544730 RepID=A0A7G6X6M7_9ACTN|nr:hypothetical protein [Kribbella qitaiheensis]QNE21892.1 hypothetical protein F1D05_33235 [Kribbella qitaiheensis]
MSTEDTPAIEPWLLTWCKRELGALPAEQLLAAAAMSDVKALRLDDGREVVIKTRPDPSGRVATCLAVQRTVAEAGLPCARPLTGATTVHGLAARDVAVDDLALHGLAVHGLTLHDLTANDPAANDLVVHAEEWRPGGEIERDTGVAAAERSARLYAAVSAITNGLRLPPPLPNPEWVHWDHDGPGHWPPNPRHDHRPGADSLPPDLLAIAARTRKRLLASTSMPHVLGHADWEAQNLRWQGNEPHTIHDWDSMAFLPESALAGAAAGCFASTETPTLAPLTSSEAFLTAYQEARNRPFTPPELEIAWAASLWPALHNARAELLWNHPPIALTELRAQAEPRLQRAAA